MLEKSSGLFKGRKLPNRIASLFEMRMLRYILMLKCMIKGIGLNFFSTMSLKIKTNNDYFKILEFLS